MILSDIPTREEETSQERGRRREKEAMRKSRRKWIDEGELAVGMTCCNLQLRETWRGSAVCGNETKGMKVEV
jgi:hypothetical protein